MSILSSRFRRGVAGAPPLPPAGAPTLSGLSALAAPIRLASGPNVPLVLYGTNLVAGSTVTIGGVPATVTWRNNQRLETAIPDGTPEGVVQVVVNNGAGTASQPLTILPPEPALPSTMTQPQATATNEFCWFVGDVPDWQAGVVISPVFTAAHGAFATPEPLMDGRTAVLDTELPSGFALQGILVRQFVGATVSFPSVQVVAL